MGEVTEREYRYWLSRVEGIGAVKARKLLEYAGSFEAIYNMKKEMLNQLSFLNRTDRNQFLAAQPELNLRRREYDRLDREQIRFVTPDDPEYPARLRNIYDMPMWLFVKGRLPEDILSSAAVIGARSCTAYGRQEAENLGRILAENGIQVISGLAFGIDSFGHRGVVEAGGAAYAVLGSGVDVCYPDTNLELYHAILEKGGILSEYGPGGAPLSSHFPVRNRIISGLSDAVIVVEARKRSGSLITADLALEQGKEVFAFPGRRTDPLSAGCNGLIRQGAAMVTDPNEVLEFFQINCKKSIKDEKKTANGLAKTEKMVYSCLDSQPKHVEEIMNLCGLASGGCMSALLNLEMDGLIVQAANQYYMRKLE